ncbi:MAG: polysaccharide deacetylase family protein [Verrucomicrobiales bacterium]
MARNIMVVTGIAEITGEEQWPADTTTAKRLQTALEYMGYELQFRRATDLAKQGFPTLAPSVAGIIIEGNVRVPIEKERRFVDWISKCKAAGKKLLVLGSVPIRDHLEMRRLMRSLGISGSLVELKRPTSVSFARHDRAMMDFEVETRPLKVRMVDLHAPPSAEVFLSVAARGGTTRIRFDPVFSARWGGMILAPYGSFQASDKSQLSYVDTFAFLAKIWPEGEFPAPDVTTRDGLRSVFFHVDGDGFTTLSHSKRGVTSGSLITEQFLKAYPFPATVSVIEADTRALQVGLQDEDQKRFETEARTMFALPFVEAATHTFSHPFIWIENDEAEYQDTYEARFLKLKPRAEYPQIDYDREITGSADYIEQQLLPDGKKVEALLWSGNCRPGPLALAAARRRGLVSLNGGDTVISRRHPGISGIAPRTTYWGDELQVYAPNQNDYVYTNDWEGPIYSGFAQAIETFKLTEKPRRLKPVNVYYHFYSGAMLSSISALHQVYRWCEKQPLHSITAATYARIAKDSHHTEIYKIADRHWRIVNEGHLRTFRVPARLGFPDIAACVGVTGFKDEGAWRYIHTSGLPETHLVLGDQAPRHLFLISSSAEIKFSAGAPDRAEFEAKDLRPIHVVLGGAPPGQACAVSVNGEERQVHADESGEISIILPTAVIAKISTNARESAKQAAN